MRCRNTISVMVIFVTLCSGYPQYKYSSEDQTAAATDLYLDRQERYDNGESFYPSFAPFSNPPLGHSRPLYQPEAAYSHRPAAAYQQQVGFDTSARFSGYKGDNSNGNRHVERASESGGLLGSGNFGVLQGGTFYNENDDVDSGFNDQFNYYRNGHGRPYPKQRQYQQFENFRDFADINVPSNPAYSHYVVVYANKNGSKHEPPEQRNKPKNIIEHLALLDQEFEQIPEKKLSKSKRKLAKLPLEKKRLTKKATTTTIPASDLYEPLLALS